MPNWFKKYFAEVWDIHMEASARENQAYKRDGIIAQQTVIILNTFVVFFAPIPPLAKAIRWKLFGV